MSEELLKVNSGLWRREFGDDYAVPEEVATTLFDLSWHNDTSPSFSLLDPVDVVPTLYVDHPEPDKRGDGFDLRYMVYMDGEPMLETDDLDEALNELYRLSGKERHAEAK